MPKWAQKGQDYDLLSMAIGPERIYRPYTQAERAPSV